MVTNAFARSGIAAHWKGFAYKSILEVAEACGVPVRWSCRTGVCHTCESGLISGSVGYGPEPLDKPAPRQSSHLPLTTDSRCRHRFIEADRVRRRSMEHGHRFSMPANPA